MNSSLLSAKTKSSSPSPLSLAWPLPLGPFDPVAAHVVLVTRVHRFAHTALAVAEHRLGEVLLRDVDVLATLDVADAPAIDGALDRFLDLVLVAAQEALSVADRLVLAGEAPVNDLLHSAPRSRDQASRRGTGFAGPLADGPPGG
jgi:hypothetical protein